MSIFFLAPSAEGRNRTGDTRIFSPLLYRLSYLGVPRQSNRTPEHCTPSLGDCQENENGYSSKGVAKSLGLL